MSGSRFVALPTLFSGSGLQPVTGDGASPASLRCPLEDKAGLRPEREASLLAEWRGANSG